MTVKTICCIGAGYVGGSTMAVIASRCPDIRVLVVDKDAEKIDRWNSPHLDLPIYEPGLEELVGKTRDTNLFFRDDIDQCIREAEMVFICVDTPMKLSGMGAGSVSDTSNCEDCARRIAQVATEHKIVVEKSTVPVRTADALREVLRANCRPGVSFEVISNPEFLAGGSALENLLTPNRVLIGGEDTEAGKEAVEKLVQVYSNWVSRDNILTSSIWSTELTKLVANAFLAQRISSINSISAICEATGANVHEVARAVGADNRIGDKFLNASLGFGGSSFQRDVLSLVYLAQSLYLPEVAEYWRRVVEINDFQKQRFVRKMLQTMYNSVTGKKICLYGFAHKKNTSEVRETAASSVIRFLLAEKAVVSLFAPYVKDSEVLHELERQGLEAETLQQLQFFPEPYAAAADAHAVVIITDWEGLQKLDYEQIYASMAKPAFFFDGQNALPHDHLLSLGAEVHAIGQASFK
ncbi:hypothetical protein Poli38472_010311 [Pythium oligandrum]|uniref:UDP-glucose 6-dehydrogenase n=1 Tax=Pythium oligandrum TaxID=41045 RepID=A0A8K1C2X6_PYTOL|nr:hypothetical protein Poli38472_010311 [Pythium oligandrum]|eukprot:TMW55429.1 hypothetical protein Poli38472_010311 [Pythium oligandrum]